METKGKTDEEAEAKRDAVLERVAAVNDMGQSVVWRTRGAASLKPYSMA